WIRGFLPARTLSTLIAEMVLGFETVTVRVVPGFSGLVTRRLRSTAADAFFLVQPLAFSALGQLLPVHVTWTVAPCGTFLTDSGAAGVAERAGVGRAVVRRVGHAVAVDVARRRAARAEDGRAVARGAWEGAAAARAGLGARDGGGGVLQRHDRVGSTAEDAGR